MTHKKTFFHPNVLFRMIITPIVIGLILYLSIYLYMEYLHTKNSYGKELFNEFMTLVLLTIITIEVVFPVLVTVKATFDARHYLNYLAELYNTTLVPITTLSKYKYIFIAIFYSAIMFILLLFINSLTIDKPYTYLWILFFIPLYILIYQNLIYGLKLAIGDDFKSVYKENRSQFMKKGIFFILLMHIPFMIILQPWFLMLLGNIYFQNIERSKTIQTKKEV